jgi:retron-type reverse transcriptase
LTGRYAFGTARRFLIPKLCFAPEVKLRERKPDGGKRPLTVLSPRDKVVCNALLLVLEPVYEGLNYRNEVQDRRTEIPHLPKA